jgi:predicted RNase H-like HicB family nuclease
MNETELECAVQDLLRRPYTKVIRGEPGDGYLALVPELPGCVTAGETDTEALTNLHEAMALWLESALTDGDPIPAPAVDTLETRDVHLLLPRHLYRQITDRATAAGLGLNDAAVALLTEALAAPLSQPSERGA